MKRLIKVSVILIFLVMSCCAGSLAPVKINYPSITQQIGDKYRTQVVWATLRILRSSNVHPEKVFIASLNRPKLTDSDETWVNWLTMSSFLLSNFFTKITNHPNYCKDVRILTKQGMLIAMDRYMKNYLKRNRKKIQLIGK